MPKLFEANKDDSPRGGPRVTQSGFSGSRGRPGTKRTFRVASRKLAAEWRCSPIPKGVGPRVFCVSTFSSTSKAAFSSGKGTPFLRTSWFADSAWADDGRRLQGARRPEPEPTAGPPDARNRQSLQELSERCGHGRKSLIRHLGDPGGSDLMTTIGPGRRISAGSTPHEIGEGPTKSLRPRSGPALFDIEPLGGRVKLGVVHDDLEPGNTTAKTRATVGWSMALSSPKTSLESASWSLWPQ